MNQTLQTSSGKNQPHKDRIMRGIIYGALAFGLLAAMSACVKLLSPNHHVIEIVFYRNLIALVPFFLFIILRKRYDLFTVKQPKLLALRVSTGVIGMIVTFLAVIYLPLSDANVLFMTSTLIIPVIAAIVLKEKTGPLRWLAIIAGFGGVCLAATPSGQAQFLGVVIALAAAMFHAVIHVFLRLLKEESSFTITLYFLLGGVLVSACFLPWVARPPQMAEAGLLLTVGITAAMAQYCMAAAFKHAPATIVAPFNYTALLWASAFDVLIWDYVPTWHVFVGGAIIIGAKVFIVHRERLATRRRDMNAKPTT